MLERVDAQLLSGLQAFTSQGGVDLSDIPAQRLSSNAMLELMKTQIPPVLGVASEDRLIPGPADAPDVAIRISRPIGSEELPVLLWMHGGGYVIGSIDVDDFMVKQMALAAQCAIVSVEYRLAPEHPFPAPIEDCYAALKWIYRNAGEMNFDRSRIAIGGASAGGGLAASLGLLARDRGEIPLAFQLLIYPMLDDTNIAAPSDESPDTLIWSRRNNLLGWRAYLGCEPGDEGTSEYASAARAADLSALPPTFISVGALDLFLEESMEYARRLMRAGAATELHVYPGAFHVFDGVAPGADVVQRFNRDRDSALKRAFAR